MQIDKDKVSWDDSPSIDSSAIQWESSPSKSTPTNGERFAQGLKDPIDGGAQLLVNALPKSVVDAGDRFNNWLADKTGLVGRLPEGGVNQQVKETNDKFKSDGVDWYRMGGNVLSPANLAIAAKVPAAASLGGRMLQGAGTGAAMGAITPTSADDYWASKGEQVGLSAAFGGAVPAVTGGVSRMISPKASVNPDLAMLKAEGVTPTIGQTLGGRWNALEEKLQSLPVAGDAITNARKAAQESFNKAAINRAVEPIGVKVEGVGQKAVAEAGDALSSAYKTAIDKVKFVTFDDQFANDLSQLKGMAGGLEPKFQRQFSRLISDKLGTRTSPNGSMLGDNYKAVISDLGDEVRKFQGMTNSAAVDYSNAVKQLQNLMQKQIGRGGDPEAAALMNAADKGWTNLVRLEGASKAAMNSEGVFTPAQLNMAARQADASIRDRATARGKALMQDLGTAGQNVLGNKVPDSGTAGRMLPVGTGAAFMANPLLTSAGLLGGAALYSNPAQRALSASVSARPQLAKPVAEGVRNSFPYLIPSGAGLLNYQGQ